MKKAILLCSLFTYCNAMEKPATPQSSTEIQRHISINEHEIRHHKGSASDKSLVSVVDIPMVASQPSALPTASQIAGALTAIEAAAGAISPAIQQIAQDVPDASATGACTPKKIGAIVGIVTGCATIVATAAGLLVTYLPQ